MTDKQRPLSWDEFIEEAAGEPGEFKSRVIGEGGLRARLASLGPSVPVAKLQALVNKWTTHEDTKHPYDDEQNDCAKELLKLIEESK